ncbi:D-alanyl-D-alanine carboxypeptidase (penicillin-binding protein 5/6) [Sphaerotilus sulfidivorans]|jgi:D-alanyl-D-alanine carboxypeptidase (penicillin-binding protein 5/6)|uniref:serine-type D-Ala-D-Ala carboxypeptidase n=1 Tax=Sphaerotilus sulfidivorans TaxID=639200 RepID=A0A5C1Q6F2_9BURK|nr:D-alanyl-D-alanine carboxypeptidase family protein [Sphaerotilus sulfidivorans]MCK6403649.1 D-alanyl-D-alanine carboxypeptidase [Sphaerotilus sulfidivorans]NZD45222.1 D-alanyl-D-alanine carboxypeptidase [Sphaerotilus sulfidivorans]QEN02294.1 D-alanyl-D-alanine carboxypeptidase [Sphaerotilus sulfidivorans]
MKRLLASLALAALLPQTVFAQALPQPPEIAARAYVLLDLSANQPLASRDADVTVEPASLTKLMTAYLVFQALRDKKLALDQELTVSERAWRTGMTDASRMYIQVGNKVKVEDLIKGMIVQSGNDATVLLAEAVGGSVENFVAMMNRQAQAFGLKVSQFRNPEGLPAPGHVSTVRELGIIATRLLQDFPGEVKFYSIKEFTFNKITQQNRNLLLWRDPSVDGLKTGYTDAAGYCLIATAKRDLPNGPRRLLSVVVGASSKESRAVESQKLLNWGYSSWDAVKVYDARQVITSAEVWKGAAATAKIGTQVPVSVAVPRGEAAQVKTQLVRTDPLIAPLSQGQQVGTLKVLSGTRVLAEVPVTVLEPVAQAGMFGRAWDQLRLWLR